MPKAVPAGNVFASPAGTAADSAGFADGAEFADGAAVDALISRTANGMGQNLEFSSGRIKQLIEHRYSQMRGDRRWAELLQASIASNVETAVHVLRHGIPAEGVPPPAAAVEYARRMAQHAIPSDVLLRSYRSGLARLQDEFVRRMGVVVDEMPEGSSIGHQTVLHAVRRVIRVLYEYFDSVSEQLLVVYADERDRWETGGNSVRAAMVRRVLDGHADLAAAERELGYDLGRIHLAAQLWLPEGTARRDAPALLERSSRRLGTLLRASGAPLMVAADEVSVWAWYPMDAFRAAAVGDDLRAAWDAQWSGGPDDVEGDGARVSVSLGSAASGPDGFRRSHRHAGLARSVATMAGRSAGRATGYDEPGLSAVAMLCSDLDAAAVWVAEALGRLGEATEYAARMRETIRMFYLHGASHKAAATALHVHPNTVKYRVRKAEESLGRPLQENRSDIELAVSICHWLGGDALMC